VEGYDDGTGLPHRRRRDSVPHCVAWTSTENGTRPRPGLAAEGWAIDEGAVLVAGDGPPRVEGLASAYRVARVGERVSVTVVRAAPEHGAQDMG
jgi:hypothetical protein